MKGDRTAVHQKGCRMRIVCFTQYFYPEQFRINDICVEWAKRGYEVIVITGIPNYPSGRFYRGYGLFRRRTESYQGVRVVRLPIIARGKNKIQLALNYLSFLLSALFWSCITRERADLVFCFGTSPMTQALPGVCFSKRRRIPLFLYVQDLWPENFQEATAIESGLIISLISKMMVFIYINCKQIFVTSKSFVSSIANRGIPQDKIVFWPQYAEEFYRPMVERSSLVPPDKRVSIAFTGNIGTAQGLQTLVRAAARLKNKDVEVRFVIVGDGRDLPSLKRAVVDENVEEYFLFIPRQDPREIPYILSSVDAAYISFANKPFYGLTLPAKLQSCMACGLPILLAARGETRNVVQEARCGLFCDPGDENALEVMIMSFISCTEIERRSMGKRGLQYAHEHYNKSVLMCQMDKFLNSHNIRNIGSGGS